jgi:hypothetical protein
MHRSVLLLFAACATPPTTITGPTQTFQVDGVDLPSTVGDADAFAIDFNGDGYPDNEFANFMFLLDAGSNVARDVQDLMADGVFRESVQLTFGVDGAVGITIGDSDQLRAQPTEMGAIATDGPQPVAVQVELPALVDADPIAVTLEPCAVELVADATGYWVQIQGLASGQAFRDAATAALVQMVSSNPRDHLLLAEHLDVNRDGQLGVAEAETSELLADLLMPDVDGGTSFGYRLHVSPAGFTGSVVDHCSDRVLDGDETDLDCGGSCHPCAATDACTVDADCDSSSCVAGHCQPPSCSDGIRDGFELDVDCGDGCHGCPANDACYFNVDCASGFCDDRCVL